MIAQIFIAVFGVLAVWLSQQSNAQFQKYACIFGLVSQPFWFYSSWDTQQWGIFALSFFYAFAWAQGFKNHWLPGTDKTQVALPPQELPIWTGHDPALGIDHSEALLKVYDKAPSCGYTTSCGCNSQKKFCGCGRSKPANRDHCFDCDGAGESQPRWRKCR